MNNITGPGIRQRAIANGYLFVQTMIWGLSFIWTKNINAEMPTIAYLAVRFLIAAVTVLPLLLLRRVRRAFSPAFFRASLVLGGLLFGSMMLQTYGLNMTSVTNSSFITSTTVLIVPVFERMLFKKKLSPALWAGVLIAFFGITVLSGGLSMKLNLGDVLTLLCAAGFALHIVLAAKYGEQHPAEGLGALQVVVAAALFAAVWGAYGFNLDGFRPGLLFGIVFMGVVSTSVGFAGMVMALKYTRPTIAGIICAMEPIFATMFALFIPGADGTCESITLRTGLGILAVLAGVTIALADSFLPRRRVEEAQTEAAD